MWLVVNLEGQTQYCERDVEIQFKFIIRALVVHVHVGIMYEYFNIDHKWIHLDVLNKVCQFFAMQETTEQCSQLL